MLNVITYIIVSFAALQLLIALVNLIFGLKKVKYTKAKQANISVLIPARNEEKTLPHLLSDLAQDKNGIKEILIYDDESTDATALIVERQAQLDKRIRLLKSKPLPNDWLGKNHACYQLSQEANGEYYLFLDADVRLHTAFISEMLGRLQNESAKLLSVFPKQTMQSLGEWLSVPLMNQILLSLLPLPLVRKAKQSSLAAANGQFMLFESKTYTQLQPHQHLKSEKVEDIRIARLYKQNNLNISCLSSETGITCRMYDNGEEAIKGFSKNLTQFFGGSALLAFFYWLMQIPALIWVATFGSSFSFIFMASALILNRLFVAWSSHQSALRNILFFIPQQLVLVWIILQAIVKQKNQTLEWKGRNISSLPYS